MVRPRLREFAQQLLDYEADAALRSLLARALKLAKAEEELPPERKAKE